MIYTQIKIKKFYESFLFFGGFGTRLDHEGKIKAKPMVEIGNKPLLMHIIENFHSQGFKEFVFCLGFNSKSIINYFILNNKNKIKNLSKSKKLLNLNILIIQLSLQEI